MFITIFIKGPASINADPEFLGKCEWQPPKRKYGLETVEHGSLNVISAKFEVSW
jgi:hypothetical protein